MRDIGKLNVLGEIYHEIIEKRKININDLDQNTIIERLIQMKRFYGWSFEIQG